MNNVWFVGQRHHQLIGCTTTTTTTTTKTKTKRKLGLYPPPVVRPPSSLLTLALRWDSSSSSISSSCEVFPSFSAYVCTRSHHFPITTCFVLFFVFICVYLIMKDAVRNASKLMPSHPSLSLSLSLLSLSPLPSFPSFAWCAHQLLIEAWTIQTAASMTFVRETPWRRADEWYRTRHSPSGDAYPSWRKLLGGDGRRGRKDDERLTSKGVTKRLFSLVSFFLPPPPQTSNLFAGSLQVGWCARPSYLLSSKININISLGGPSVGPSVPPSVRLGDRVWKTVYYFFFAFAGNLCCWTVAYRTWWRLESIN